MRYKKFLPCRVQLVSRTCCYYLNDMSVMTVTKVAELLGVEDIRVGGLARESL